MKSIERPNGRGLVRRVYGGFTRQSLWRACLPFISLWLVYQPFTSLLPAFYQPLAGWLVGWLAGWRIIGEGLCNYLFLADFKV
ncbi:MAG TPA: hypothetical protein PLS62_12710 [Desulfobacteraceae bacterium]|nr:hypothetical protein [Desulfobacteraceae bacterium]